MNDISDSGNPRPDSASGPGAGEPTPVLRHCPLPAPDDYVPFPRAALEASVVDRFEAQVALRESRAALSTGEMTLTYGELNAAANRAARQLLSSGTTNDAPVAVLMDLDDPVIPAILGILKAGRAYVVLEPLDTPERHAWILSKAGIETIITTGARIESINNLPVRPLYRLVWEDLAGGSDANPGVPMGPDCMAALFFTSGSTGEPKGVVRDHRQLLHSSWSNTNDYFVSPSDQHALLHFPGFSASVRNVYDALLNGAALCTLNPRQVSTKDLLRWLHRERITRFNPSVGLWRSLVHTMQPGDKWPELRQITLGGEPIHGTDVRRFQSLFCPGAVLRYGLSMSETGNVTRGYIDHTIQVGGGPVLAGYPAADKDITILDDHDRKPAEPDAGDTGRIVVTSAYLSPGYWRDNALTAAAFHPAADGSPRRAFLTGDRGRVRPDGCLEYHGRLDSVVKVRGYRVDTDAVEAALQGCPSVSQAAVVAKQRDDGRNSLVAFLTCTEGDPPAPDELRAHLSGSLSHFMIPERFVRLNQFPLTATGKIDRRMLSAFNVGFPNRKEHLATPRTETERHVAGIWAEVLELDRVGINENFLDLGGDSLLAMTMLEHVEERLGVSAPPEALSASNVAELARMLDGSPPGKDVDRAAALTRTRPASCAGVSRSLRGLLQSWMRIGPVWRGHALPYGAGVRLQRLLVTQRWLYAWLFPRQIQALGKWGNELGDKDEKAAMTKSLLSNTWRIWRSEALRRPAALESWVVIRGSGRHLLESRHETRGVVFCVPHAGRLMPPLQSIVESHGRETAKVVNKPLDKTAAGAMSRRDFELRAAQLRDAQRILRRRGAVFIAGDGKQGSQTVTAPFHGRQRPFQIGAAWLAVMGGAHLVPVFVSIDTRGRWDVEITAPLLPAATNRREQVVELTRRYAALYSKRWPRIYATMAWGQLIDNYELPAV